jgi:hypothetical protein
MMTMDEFFSEAKRLGCRMHLDPEDQRAAFDAKDAEIERLRAALAAQPTLMGWVCTDLDGRAGIGFTKEQAKRQAGEHCDEYIPVFDNGAQQEPANCKYCGGSGDVHTIDGEWRGRCTECDGSAQPPTPTKEPTP